MALNNLGLGFVFTARDLASGAIGNLERNFMSLDSRVGLGTDNIQSAFQQLGVGMAVFTAGAATVGAAFSLANAAGRFEQAVASAGAIAGATAEELTRLRRENRQLRVEREILSKAAAWFAQETAPNSKRSSDS